MTVLRRLLLAVVLALSSAAVASARAPDPAALVAQANARGQLIYDYDQAAWHSSDVLVKRLNRKRLAEVRGWLVEPDGDALTVLYYGYEGDTPYGVFMTRFRNGKVVDPREIAADGPRALTQAQARMAQARKAATASGAAPCAQAPFNTVIVPPVSEIAPVEVYLLTPQTQQGAYPFGGHYLVTVGPDGKIAGTRPFMKSCMTQALPANAMAAMVTHLLDPTPTEIHAWLSRWMGKPVYVMVTEPQQLWEVTAKGMVKVDKP